MDPRFFFFNVRGRRWSNLIEKKNSKPITWMDDRNPSSTLNFLQFLSQFRTGNSSLLCQSVILVIQHTLYWYNTSYTDVHDISTYPYPTFGYHFPNTKLKVQGDRTLGPIHAPIFISGPYRSYVRNILYRTIICCSKQAAVQSKPWSSTRSYEKEIISTRTSGVLIKFVPVRNINVTQILGNKKSMSTITGHIHYQFMPQKVWRKNSRNS